MNDSTYRRMDARVNRAFEAYLAARQNRSQTFLLLENRLLVGQTPPLVMRGTSIIEALNCLVRSLKFSCRFA